MAQRDPNQVRPRHSVKDQLQEVLDGAATPELFVHGLSAFLVELAERDASHPVLTAFGRELSRASNAPYAASALRDLRSFMQAMLVSIDYLTPASERLCAMAEPGEDRQREALNDLGVAARLAEDCLREAGLEYRSQAAGACSLGEVVGLSVQLCQRLFRGRPTLEIRDVENIRVKAPRTHLLRVVMNLLQNAAQATRLESAPSVEVTTWATEAHAFVQVADNGPGIHPTVQREIFDVFYTTKAEGSGLGLFVCRTFVSGWGGQILVESPDTGGTRFIFSIPRVETPVEQ